MFELKKTEGKARRGEFTCAHGTVQTPVFMNVGTQGAIKGALSAEDLKNIGCQVELSNTYHLHLRPTDKVVREMGGLHKFMTWDGPILTDSGGSACPDCGKSRKKAYISPLISTVAKFSWARKKACRSSPI